MRSGACLLAVTCLVPVLVGAAPPPAMSPARKNQVVVEMIYEYSVREYTPPLAIVSVRREASSTATPEDTAAAYLSSMDALDYPWWSSLWTAGSWARMEEIDRAEKRTPEFWVNAWERAFRGRRFELTQRLDTGEFVILIYRERERADALLQKIVLKHEEGGWRATQELSSDPVLHHWNEPGFRAKNVVRSVAAPQ